MSGNYFYTVPPKNVFHLCSCYGGDVILIVLFSYDWIGHASTWSLKPFSVNLTSGCKRVAKENWFKWLLHRQQFLCFPEILNVKMSSKSQKNGFYLNICISIFVACQTG